MFFVAVYSPTEACGADEKKMFYAELDYSWFSAPTETHSGDFHAAIGTERAGYKLCVGPHDFGTKNTNSSLLLNFA